MKHFIPTNSIRSAGALMEDSGLVKPAKVTHWSTQKMVPHDILVARAEQEGRAEIRANREALSKKSIGTAKLGVFAQTVENGYKVIGFGVVAATMDEVFALAKEHGRAFVKLDGVEVNG